MEFPLRHSLIVPFALALSTSAIAQTPPAEPVPLAIDERNPAARDIPSPGTISIDVDATDTARAIFRVKQTIPVAAAGPDRKCVVSGKRVSVRVDPGGRRRIQKKKYQTQ